MSGRLTHVHHCAYLRYTHCHHPPPSTHRPPPTALCPTEWEAALARHSVVVLSSGAHIDDIFSYNRRLKLPPPDAAFHEARARELAARLQPYMATHSFFWLNALWGYAKLDADGNHIGGVKTGERPLEEVLPPEKIYNHWRWPLIPGMNDVIERVLKVQYQFVGSVTVCVSARTTRLQHATGRKSHSRAVSSYHLKHHARTTTSHPEPSRNPPPRPHDPRPCAHGPRRRRAALSSWTRHGPCRIGRTAAVTFCTQGKR